MSAPTAGWAQPDNARGTKPNIVLINTDDLGFGDLSCYGATKLKTPNIDSLAKAGRRFLDAHSPSAVCSPSRYGLLTGRYPFRNNFWGPLNRHQPLSIDTKRLTLAKLLKDANYATACIGKWHLGFGEKKTDWNSDLNPGPLELGFDYYFGLPVVNCHPPFVYVENHRVVGLDPKDPLVDGQKSVTKFYAEKSGYNAVGGAKAAHRLYVDDHVGITFAEKAVTWLKQQKKDKPFFLYFATTHIHHPFTPSPRFIGSSDCGLYGDFVHELDWMVGELMRTLDELGQKENTLVIFTSDNGGMLNVTGQKAWKAGHRLNGALLGFKFGVWEGGHRIPMIARWPGQIPPNSTSTDLISHIDLLATFAALVDRPIKSDEGPDSINQLNTFTGSPAAPLRTTLVLQPNSPKHLGIRQGDWVYIPQQDAGGFQSKRPGQHLFGGGATMPFCERTTSDVVDGAIRDDAPPAQLFNLKNDPFQTTNTFHQHPEVVTRLDALLNDYRSEISKKPRLGWINLRQ